MTAEERDLAIGRLFEGSFVKLIVWRRIPTIFVWTTSISPEGIRYGSYKYLSKDDLADRKFKVEFFDGTASILFTDCYYDPRTYKVVRT